MEDLGSIDININDRSGGGGSGGIGSGSVGGGPTPIAASVTRPKAQPIPNMVAPGFAKLGDLEADLGQLMQFFARPSAQGVAALTQSNALVQGLGKFGKAGSIATAALTAFGAVAGVSSIIIASVNQALDVMNRRVSEISKFSAELTAAMMRRTISELNTNIEEAAKNGRIYASVIDAQTGLAREWDLFVSELLAASGPFLENLLRLGQGLLKALRLVLSIPGFLSRAAYGLQGKLFEGIGKISRMYSEGGLTRVMEAFTGRRSTNEDKAIYGALTSGLNKIGEWAGKIWEWVSKIGSWIGSIWDAIKRFLGMTDASDVNNWYKGDVLAMTGRTI